MPARHPRVWVMGEDCVYKGTKFADGSIVCQEGREFRCDDGQLEPVESECSEAGPPPAISEEEGPQE